MGNDGGSIPRRCELVKEKKKEKKADPVQLERAKWLNCAMTNEPLRDPIVTCDLGYLYNKEAVLSYLVAAKGISTEEQSTSSSSNSHLYSHIRGLKDILPVHFTPNPGLNKFTSKPSTSAPPSSSSAPFVCPITMLELGHYKFSVLRTCGCAMSERALREVPSEACLVCGKKYNKDEDILPLNPSPEELIVLRKKMEERRAQEPKKEKKEKRKRDDAQEESSTTSTTTTTTSSSSNDSKDSSQSSSDSSSSSQNSGKDTNGSNIAKKRPPASVPSHPSPISASKVSYSMASTAV